MVDVPPPPENPFMNENGDMNGNGNGEQTLDQGTPDVAARPGRVLIVLAVTGAVLSFLLYNIFSGDDKAKEGSKEPRKVATAEPIQPPPLPETPALPIQPPPAIVAPVIPEPTKLDIIQPQEDGAQKQQALDRMKSKMMISDGGGLNIGSSTSEATTQRAAINGDPNSAFEASVVAAHSQADRVEATRIGALNRTIAQGRIIHATMESALNTDLPAPIRAIVSRDTFGEAGREPLIPKGSRLIGMYNTDLTGGQSRIYVIWTRVIRPDGVDIMINSPLVDQIGISGMGGQVDTKFQSIFSRAALSSMVAIATAITSDELSGGSTTTTTNGTGSTTTGDAATTATVDALNRLGGVSDNFIQRFIDMRPTILVDQGTQVNVFVNRDLLFPTDMVVSGPRVLN